MIAFLFPFAVIILSCLCIAIGNLLDDPTSRESKTAFVWDIPALKLEARDQIDRWNAMITQASNSDDPSISPSEFMVRQGDQACGILEVLIAQKKTNEAQAVSMQGWIKDLRDHHERVSNTKASSEGNHFSGYIF